MLFGAVSRFHFCRLILHFRMHGHMSPTFHSFNSIEIQTTSDKSGAHLSELPSEASSMKQHIRNDISKRKAILYNRIVC